ncbi:hypothetical protein [Saccharopolyspora sp. SCSIO 74807]|uniref:hypothetical protein n=1 Tax=Saccharopolyspora sp. SCSIO 74807 TaxID=3118084 RepID=UPI0030CD8B0A
MSQDLDELMRGFEGIFGYPPDDNVVTRAEAGGESEAIAELSSMGASSDLLEFYSEVHEVSLPDVQNGLFIESATAVVDGAKDGQPTRVTGAVEDSVIVIGSDGGGGLFALSRSDGKIYLLQGGALVGSTYEVESGGVEVIANELPSLLEGFHQKVREALQDA